MPPSVADNFIGALVKYLRTALPEIKPKPTGNDHAIGSDSSSSRTYVEATISAGRCMQGGGRTRHEARCPKEKTPSKCAAAYPSTGLGRGPPTPCRRVRPKSETGSAVPCRSSRLGEGREESSKGTQHHGVQWLLLLPTWN
jgi:hypothetical protein